VVVGPIHLKHWGRVKIHPAPSRLVREVLAPLDCFYPNVAPASIIKENFDFGSLF
jgi:hypothetical protein